MLPHRKVGPMLLHLWILQEKLETWIFMLEKAPHLMHCADQTKPIHRLDGSPGPLVCDLCLRIEKSQEAGSHRETSLGFRANS